MSGAAAAVIRVARAWRSLSHEHHLAAAAAALLFLTLFFPWYQETVVSARRASSASVSGWGAFSLVEAVVLLVVAGVLALLFRRGEGRGWRQPSADGMVIAAAGTLCAALVIVRMFDKETVQVKAPGLATTGIEWGIFLALAMALFLAYAGNRIRTAAPGAPGDEQPTGSFEPVVVAPRRDPRPPRRGRIAADQLTIPLDERRD